MLFQHISSLLFSVTSWRVLEETKPWWITRPSGEGGCLADYPEQNSNVKAWEHDVKALQLWSCLTAKDPVFIRAALTVSAHCRRERSGQYCSFVSPRLLFRLAGGKCGRAWVTLGDLFNSLWPLIWNPRLCLKKETLCGKSRAGEHPGPGHVWIRGCDQASGLFGLFCTNGEWVNCWSF